MERDALRLERHLERLKLGYSHVVVRIVHSVVGARLELELGKHDVAVEDVNLEHLFDSVQVVGRIVQMVLHLDEVELTRLVA